MDNPTFKIMDEQHLDYRTLIWYIENDQVYVLAKNRTDLVMHVN